MLNCSSWHGDILPMIGCGDINFYLIQTIDGHDDFLSLGTVAFKAQLGSLRLLPFGIGKLYAGSSPVILEGTETHDATDAFCGAYISPKTGKTNARS